MKIKRILSFALALLLGLAVLVPASANGVMMGGPDAPIITKQPVNIYSSSTPLFVQAGNAFQLSVEAVLPEGSQGTLSYAWYDYNWQPGDTTPPIATGASVTIPTTEDMLIEAVATKDGLKSVAVFDYCVVVTNTWLDDEQVQQAASRRSDVVQVRLFVDYGTAISMRWEDAMVGSGTALFMNMPFLILLTGLDLFGVLMCKLGVFGQGLVDNINSILK